MGSVKRQHVKNEVKIQNEYKIPIRIGRVSGDIIEIRCIELYML